MHSSVTFPEMMTLGNSIRIPVIGFGTYKIGGIAEMTRVVKSAYEAGYRHLDTASFYKNEKAIGRALKNNHIPREQMFITSKVWISDMGYDKTLKSFEKSCRDLGTSYMDLYLIHWPGEDVMGTWMALERLYAEGRIRAIGVSNFTISDLKVIVESNHIKPLINQIELHPGYPQLELQSYCRRHLIAVAASAPLGRGEVFDSEVCRQIADAAGKSISQVVLRWQYQLGVISLPKSADPLRLAQNIDIFDFSLDREQMDAISSISGNRLFKDPEIQNRI